MRAGLNLFGQMPRRSNEFDPTAGSGVFVGPNLFGRREWVYRWFGRMNSTLQILATPSEKGLKLIPDRKFSILI